jgi:YggT family protein
MELGSTFIEAVAVILDQVITLYIWVVIAAAVISWFRPDPYNPIVQIIYRLTEPVYAFIRRYVPTSFQGIDFAPIIVLLALQFFKLFFIKLLINFAQS